MPGPSEKEIPITEMNPEDLNCSSREALNNTKDTLWKIPCYIPFFFFFCLIQNLTVTRNHKIHACTAFFPVIVIFCLLTFTVIVYRKWKVIKRFLNIRFRDEAKQNVEDIDNDAFVN